MQRVLVCLCKKASLPWYQIGATEASRDVPKQALITCKHFFNVGLIRVLDEGNRDASALVL